VAEVPVPHKTPWLGWGLVAFILLTGILGGLVWRYSQGKPLLSPLQPMADIVQQLQGWWQPREQPASVPSRPPASVPTPAKQVVTPPPPPAPSPGLETLPVDWAEARYRGMVNAKGGQLLVIQGEVTNKGKAPRGPIRLKATLTDAQHRPMKEEMVYIGTTLTDQELKALDPGKIRDWLTQPGGRSQVKVLKPGEKQPFTVVFFGVPDNLAEAHSGFQLVVVEGPAATSSP